MRRRLPKRAGGPKHHDALNWSEVGAALARIDAGQCRPSTKRAMRFNGADGGPAGGGQAGDLGPVRPRGGGVGQARGGDEDCQVSPGAAVTPSAGHPCRGPEGDAGHAGVPRQPSGRDDGQFGDDAGAAHGGDRGVGPRLPFELQGLGAASTTWTNCSRSSRSRTSRDRRRWPPTPETTCWESVGPVMQRWADCIRTPRINRWRYRTAVCRRACGRSYSRPRILFVHCELCTAKRFASVPRPFSYGETR